MEILIFVFLGIIFLLAAFAPAKNPTKKYRVRGDSSADFGDSDSGGWDFGGGDSGGGGGGGGGD
jgi:uncharacterized membrane protein YgcG